MCIVIEVAHRIRFERRAIEVRTESDLAGKLGRLRCSRRM